MHSMTHGMLFKCYERSTNMKKEFIEIANTYGWNEIESKNPYMYSLKTESREQDYRINVYTTGKVQVQPIGIKHASGRIYTDIVKPEDFEQVLIDFRD